jgi:FAD/FMN-containing dehydrogenase
MTKIPPKKTRNSPIRPQADGIQNAGKKPEVDTASPAGAAKRQGSASSANSDFVPGAQVDAQVSAAMADAGEISNFQNALSTRLAGMTGVGSAAVVGQRPESTEKLEGIFPGLEALIDSETGVPARRRAWSALSPGEKNGAGALGFEEDSWNALRSGDLSQLPQALKTEFAQLGKAEKEGAEALGFSKKGWDADVLARRDILDNKDILKAFSDLLSGPLPITTDQVKETLLPQARDWAVETRSEKRALLYLVDFQGHAFTPDARRAIRDDLITHTLFDQAAAGFSNFKPAGGDPDGAPAEVGATVVNDAGGLETTMMRERVQVRTAEDVRQALTRAKKGGHRVSIAGRRHSEGGHTITPAGIQLDMMQLNKMKLQNDGTLTVQAGATWAQVQDLLAQSGRAVKIQQSANIFTVGGSIAANIHGRTPGEKPLIDTIKSMKVMNADGEIVTCSRDENPDLFKHVLGGYGLFGVVLEVDLQTRPNTQCEMDVELIDESQYLEKFKAAQADPDVQLAWGRLDPNFSGEVLFHTVKASGDESAAAAGERDGVAIESGSRAALNKAIFNLSKTGPLALEARWALEKKTRLGAKPEATLSQFSSPNVEFLNQYWFNEGKKTDILHEYFIPLDKVEAFNAGLKKLQEKHGMNTLNCTIRDVGKDTESALPYAKKDVFSFVLYFNQDIDAEGNEKHGALTRDIIDLSIELGGTFYLPYQRHYTKEQLHKAYPEIDAFFAAKQKHDPDGVFSNRWYETYGPGQDS